MAWSRRSCQLRPNSKGKGIISDFVEEHGDSLVFGQQAADTRGRSGFSEASTRGVQLRRENNEHLMAKVRKAAAIAMFKYPRWIKKKISIAYILALLHPFAFTESSTPLSGSLTRAVATMHSLKTCCFSHECQPWWTAICDSPREHCKTVVNIRWLTAVVFPRDSNKCSGNTGWADDGTPSTVWRLPVQVEDCAVLPNQRLHCISMLKVHSVFAFHILHWLVCYLVCFDSVLPRVEPNREVLGNGKEVCKGSL